MSARRQFTALLCCVWLGFALSLLGAQDGTQDGAGELDDLFADPAADIVAEQPEVDHRAAYEEEAKVSVKGKFSATGGVAAGWQAWDMFNNPAASFDGSIGLTSTASVSFDARPDPRFRVFGSFSAGFDPLAGAAGWSAPAISELYADYILADTLYTRLGKHSSGWGQGRLFNPANLMSDSGTNYHIRFSLPAWSSLNLVLLSNKAVSYQQLVYAAKADFVLLNTLISPALRFNWNDGLKSALSLKKVAFKTDLFADVVLHSGTQLLSLTAMAGFFREWPDVLLYGEYQFKWTEPLAFAHDAALALGFNNIFGTPLDFGVQARHNFMDHSGSVTLGLTQPLWPFVKLEIGLPIVYGAEGSSAVLTNADPGGRCILLAVALTLSGGF